MSTSADQWYWDHQFEITFTIIIIGIIFLILSKGKTDILTGIKSEGRSRRSQAHQLRKRIVNELGYDLFPNGWTDLNDIKDASKKVTIAKKIARLHDALTINIVWSYIEYMDLITAQAFYESIKQRKKEFIKNLNESGEFRWSFEVDTNDLG